LTGLPKAARLRLMLQASTACTVGLLLALLPVTAGRGLTTLLGIGSLGLGAYGLSLAASRSPVTSRAWSLIIAVAALSVGFAAVRDPKASAPIILWVLIFFFGMWCLMLGGLWLIRAGLGEGWASAGLGMLGVVLGVILLVSAVIEAAWMTRPGGALLLLAGLGLAERAWRMRQADSL